MNGVTEDSISGDGVTGNSGAKNAVIEDVRSLDAVANGSRAEDADTDDSEEWDAAVGESRSVGAVTDHGAVDAVKGDSRARDAVTEDFRADDAVAEGFRAVETVAGDSRAEKSPAAEPAKVVAENRPASQDSAVAPVETEVPVAELVTLLDSEAPAARECDSWGDPGRAEDAETELAPLENGSGTSSTSGADSAEDVRSLPRTPVQRSRSIETQTERPADDVDGAERGGGQLFPVRRAVSDWAIVDRSSTTAHIRSERIRRTAQLFEDLAQAQQERQELLVSRRGGRPSLPAPAAAPAPAEREVVLVPLPPRVDAILALGSGGRQTADAGAGLDSDNGPDEPDEERLWEKVRAKIAARRSKFQQLEQGPEPSRPVIPKHSPSRLSADRTSWLSGGKPTPPPSKQATTLNLQEKTATSSRQTDETDGPSKQPTMPPSNQRLSELRKHKMSASPSHQMAEPSRPEAPAPPKRQVAAQSEQREAPVQPLQNGHRPETTRGSSGKYIEQQEEQKVLRSLGSSVLARQKLAVKQRTRQQLMDDRTEAERRRQKAESQRVDAQARLERTRGRLTRDSAFERKGLESLIARLDGAIRGETRNIAKLAGRIADTEAAIEELERRAAA